MVVLASCLACAPDELEVVWSGEHIEIATYPEDADRVCAGSGPFLDAATAAIADRLDLHDRGRITYAWVPGRLADTPCPKLSGGCGTDDVAYAQDLLVDHEIVHVLANTFGRADPFLEEGLAEYLGGSSLTPASGNPSSFTGHQRRIQDPQFYPTAGRWVAEAVALTTMDSVVDLYRASSFLDAPDRFEALVDEYLGLTMEEIHAPIRAAPTCSSLAYREDPIACSAPLLPWQDGEWIFEAVADCDDASVMGHDEAMRLHATLELDAAATILMEVEDGDDAFVFVAPCSARCDAGDVRLLAPYGETTLELAAGRYVVKARRTMPGILRIRARYDQ